MTAIAKLAVFGSPIEHSLSPLIHQHFAQQFKHQIDYQKILVTDNFASLIHDFFSDQNAIGCNITVPCKIDAFNLCTKISTRAKLAQAVNTIIKKDGILYGDNTDGIGLYLDLQRLNCPINQAHILILGAGGAARGIIEPLLAQAKSISIVNRSLDKAQALIDLFKQEHNKLYAYSYHNMPDNFDIIINATSLSLYQQLPPLKDDVYRSAQFVYDLFYTPNGNTVFTQYAKSLNLNQAYDGLGMLVSQAYFAYEAWFQVKPNIDLTLDYMRQVLSERK